MEVSTEMYTKLFNEILNIQEDMQKIIERSQKVLLAVEEMYVNGNI